MDPRHPEQAISRLDELFAQYKSILENLRSENVSSKLAEHERKGSLVVQEICLVAPRLHEAMMVVSRTRRGMFSSGFIKEEKPVENYVAPNQAETVIVEPKPRKKKISKKKED